MATKREELEMAARGEGCLGRAADDEPVFILRAQDRLAATLVRDWAEYARNNGCGAMKVDEALRLADLMDAWPHHKFPD
jgi:hypothetical protein